MSFFKKLIRANRIEKTKWAEKKIRYKIDAEFIGNDERRRNPVCIPCSTVNIIYTIYEGVENESGKVIWTKITSSTSERHIYDVAKKLKEYPKYF